MKVTFLSSTDYPDRDCNYGDCILVDTGSEFVVYDCGCEEHAKRVQAYMRDHRYTKTVFVLSHNDSDHFDGLNYLIDNNLVSVVYTHLLFKYAEDILKLIDDNRRNKDSVINSIKQAFDNIASLSERIELKDIFSNTKISNEITIVGPDKDYALNAVSKEINKCAGDTIDNETIRNAISTQLSISFSPNKKLLLTGDSSFESIKENIVDHTAIQLPHHGKPEQAKKIFTEMDIGTIYFVSDNTGNSNGGSDDLQTRGHAVFNTKNGDQVCDFTTFSETSPIKSYFRFT